MIVLAFDTCFGACSAAVLEHPGDCRCTILAARDEPMAIGHAERLMPMIAEVMAQANVAFTDLSALAVTCGPGTFTGVRTGIAAARGLALATGLPVLTTTSLALLVWTADAALDPASAGTPVIVCMAAGKGQVYTQSFGPRLDDAHRAPASEPMLATAADVAAHIMSLKNAILVGSAAESVAALASGPVAPLRADMVAVQPSARYMQGTGLQRVSPVRPLYLRQPDAIPQADKALPRVTA